MTWPLVDEPMGCVDCNRMMPLGSPYSQRLFAIDPNGDTLSDVLCVYCAFGPATYAPHLDPSELLR